jgi:hypothetical protein
MGLFNSLFGKTGPGKLAAALNALTAKHMMELSEDAWMHVMFDKIHEILMQGGYTSEDAKNKLKQMANNDQIIFLSMCAMAYMSMDISPAFPKCFAGGRWNFVSNPLIALHDADKEIKMARVIFSRYQIDVNFDS